MKAVFIVYNQSLTGYVQEILSNMMLRGYTQWTGITGTGTFKGEPHEGTHTWPELNNAHLVVTADEKANRLIEQLRSLNSGEEEQGLRAFVWSVEEGV